MDIDALSVGAKPVTVVPEPVAVAVVEPELVADAEPIAVAVVEPEPEPEPEPVVESSSVDQDLEAALALEAQALEEKVLADALAEIEAELAKQAIYDQQEKAAPPKKTKKKKTTTKVMIVAGSEASITPKAKKQSLATKAVTTPRVSLPSLLDAGYESAIEAINGFSILKATDEQQSAIKAIANKKQQERVLDLFNWLSGNGKLRCYTGYAIDAVISAQDAGITKEQLKDVYAGKNALAAKTADSQVYHYWKVLPLMLAARIEGDRMIVNPDSQIIRKYSA
jgi:hypothetical protein